MMEVIPINTNENTASKADLWADRIHTFRESGLSRKDWCQKNGIPQSTLEHADIESRQHSIRHIAMSFRMISSYLFRLSCFFLEATFDAVSFLGI